MTPRKDEDARPSKAAAALALIGLIVSTTVAVFQGRPASMLALLIAAIILALAGIRQLLTLRDQSSRRAYRPYGWIASGLLLAGIVSVLIVSPLRSLVAFELIGFDDGQTHTRILAASTSATRSTYRVTLVLTNDSDRHEVISRIALGTAFDHGIACYGAKPYYLRIRSRIYVVARDRESSSVKATVGNGNPFSRWARGQLSGQCGIGQFTLRFPAIVVVPAGQLVTVELDLPRQLDVVDSPRPAALPLPVAGLESTVREVHPSGFVRIVLAVRDRSPRLSECLRILSSVDSRLDQTGLSCSDTYIS